MTIFRHLQDQKRRNMMLCAGDGWRGRDMKVWGTKKGLIKGYRRGKKRFRTICLGYAHVSNMGERCNGKDNKKVVPCRIKWHWGANCARFRQQLRG
ncbi:hypothetical protein AVEN_100728-1 [Araneus ventricosus]|uniref:Uncharacterized protein n=1 Tax=Araneus ventricosus TaxID=182803 RepID=A0A4Y2CSV5_ARAVE|nr:hypothetical protein AVEN_100728-1 [Araneus ventricosus]